MATQGCINGTPLNGVYIALASLACMLSMLKDIFAGLRASKYWLPCNLFQLNSIILALLAAAAKLSLDSITPVLTTLDQLTKLTGTALVFISMCFLIPSTAVTTESETFKNLVSLSITVGTIVIYVGRQILSGMIVLFIPEHVTILCFLSFLLLAFWFSHWDLNNDKKKNTDTNKRRLREGPGSMFKRLKWSSVFSYVHNPQLEFCLLQLHISVASLCFICTIILIPHALRFLTRGELGSENPCYHWSMSVIFITQMLTILVGTFAVVFRSLFLVRLLDIIPPYESPELEPYNVIKKIPYLKLPKPLPILLQNLYLYLFFCVQLIVFTVPHLVVLLVSSAFVKALCLGAKQSQPNEILETEKKKDVEKKEFETEKKDVENKEFETEKKEWLWRKGKEELQRLMDKTKNKTDSKNNLFGLLSETSPSQQQPAIDPNDLHVSSFSIALLVRIAQVLSLPEEDFKPLKESFEEVYDIVLFIDKHVNLKDQEEKHKLVYAKAAWKGEGFSGPRSKNGDALGELKIIRELKDKSAVGKEHPDKSAVGKELGAIVDLIKKSAEGKDLSESVRQMFVDMLHALLAQLPLAIAKYLSDSPAERYQKRVNLAVQLVWTVEAVKDQINWKFPAEWNISSLMETPEKDDVGDTEDDVGRTEEKDHAITEDHATTEDGASAV